MNMKNGIRIFKASMIIMIIFLCGYLLGDRYTRTINKDIVSNAAVNKIIDNIDDNIDIIFNNCNNCNYSKYNNDLYVDMQKVVGFDVTEYGLQLYFYDGTGYFIER